MSSGRNPAADRAYLAAVLRAEREEGVSVQQIAERWGIPRDTVGRLLDEAKQEEAGERSTTRHRRPRPRLLRWFLRSMA